MGLAASFAACLNPFANGQESPPPVDGRVEAAVVQPPLAVPVSKAGGWDLGLVISAAYDDNVFLSATNPESDLVVRAAPSVAWSSGDETEGEGGFVKAGYRPTLVVYASNGSENRVDHQALAVAGWRGKVTRLTYSGAIGKLGDATAETGRPTTRLEFENEIRAAWIPREKIVLEATVGNRQSDYSDAELNDSSETYGQAGLRYIYSPKTELGVFYQIGRLRVDRGEDQNTQQVTARVTWQPREKIRLKIEGGVEHRKTGNDSGTNPVLEGGVFWTPREGTEVYLTGFMREEASAFYAGQNFSVRGFTAGVSQRINAAWSAKLDGGFEKDSYQLVSGSGNADREDRIWFLRPAVVRRISEDSDITLFYRLADNESNDPAFGYEQRIIGIEFNHTF